MDVGPKSQHAAVSVTKMRGDLSGGVALVSHQACQTMPQLVRRGPGDSGTLAAGLKTVSPVVGVDGCPVPGREDRICIARIALSARLLVRRRTVSGDRGMVRSPASVLALLIVSTMRLPRRDDVPPPHPGPRRSAAGGGDEVAEVGMLDGHLSQERLRLLGGQPPGGSRACVLDHDTDTSGGVAPELAIIVRRGEQGSHRGVRTTN